MNKTFQFVSWFPEWRGLYFFKGHKGMGDMAYIYAWVLGVAFWEIRKWHTLTEADKRTLATLQKAWADEVAQQMTPPTKETGGGE